ncbi:MAG: penicillin-binding transpeptidase domain-containing protein, partial [Verrucomicrobiota bacterium]
MAPPRRFPTFLFLCTLVLFACDSMRAQVYQPDAEGPATVDAPAVPAPQQPVVTENPAVPRPGDPTVPAEMSEVPAVPDTIAIPRFEETVQPEESSALVVPQMDLEDVGAVEIPTELIGEEAPGEEEEVEMAEDATVEEEVAEEDSLLKKFEGATPTRAPLTASALRARSKLDPEASLEASVLTLTEARTFTFTIPAPRGQLLDRNGYPLAQSKVAYYAAINFPFLGDDVVAPDIERYAYDRILHVNNVLGSNWSLSGKVVLDHYKQRRWFPLTFSSVLTEEEVDELQRQQMEGLVLHPVYVRHYPQNEALSHVIGYVGKRPPRATGQIVNDEPLWGQGMGVDGLEEAFETELRGQGGRVNVLFNQDGTKVKEDILGKPKPGFNVVTSIDLEMQRICENLLAEKVKRGAMVIMDVRNGDIMAMASFPQFNPNDFIPSISQEKYSALVEDPAKPLFPRAFRAAYPPASTFKVPVALGFLESGYVSAGDMYPCPNAWTIGNLTMRNWNTKGEGMMNV